MFFVLLFSTNLGITWAGETADQKKFNPLEDPVIKIQALPIDGLDIADVIAKISKDVSDNTGVPQSAITVTWVTLEPGHQNNDGESGQAFEPNKYPAVIELFLSAHLFDKKEIADMLVSIADSLSKHTPIPRDWIFIHAHVAESGQVFQGGRVQSWSDDPGPEKSSGQSGVNCFINSISI